MWTTVGGDLQQAVGICCEVWNRRNQSIWNNKKEVDAKVLYAAKQEVETMVENSYLTFFLV